MTISIICGYAVDVQRKDVRRLRLKVDQECNIKLTAPLRATDREIGMFVDSNRDWIERSLIRFKDSAGNANQWYGDGGRIRVLGDTYPVIEKTGSKLMCQITDGTVILTCPDGCPYVKKERFMREWYRGILDGIVPGMLYELETATGLHCSGYRTRYMRTKWGTCNCSTKLIWFSVRLAEKPVECIEYVVLHELIHTAVPNHGPEFKAMMDRFMPDWKERKRILNFGSNRE